MTSAEKPNVEAQKAQEEKTFGSMLGRMRLPYATQAAIENQSSNYSEERQGNASNEKRLSQREFKNGQSFGEPVSFEEQGSARARAGNSTMGRLLS